MTSAAQLTNLRTAPVSYSRPGPLDQQGNLSGLAQTHPHLLFTSIFLPAVLTYSSEQLKQSLMTFSPIDTLIIAMNALMVAGY